MIEQANQQVDPSDNTGINMAEVTIPWQHALAQELIDNAHFSLERKMVQGVLQGIMIGDALGLPVETMTRAQIAERYGRITDFLPPQINDFLKDQAELPPGITSDDLQLTLAGLKASLAFPTDGSRFDMDAVSSEFVKAYEESDLGWGGSTRRGAQALQAGTPWSSLVKEGPNAHGYTGNGIPMKVAGFALHAAATKMDAATLIEGIKNTALLTHRTVAGVGSGVAHTFALLYCMGKTPETFNSDQFLAVIANFSALSEGLYPTEGQDNDLLARFEMLRDPATWDTYRAEELFGGGGCNVIDSLPFVYAHFLGSEKKDYQLVEDLVNAGGDTDSTAALAGGLISALNPQVAYPGELMRQMESSKEVSSLAMKFCEQHTVSE